LRKKAGVGGGEGAQKQKERNVGVDEFCRRIKKSVVQEAQNVWCGAKKDGNRGSGRTR